MGLECCNDIQFIYLPVASRMGLAVSRITVEAGHPETVCVYTRSIDRREAGSEVLFRGHFFDGELVAEGRAALSRVTRTRELTQASRNDCDPRNAGAECLVVGALLLVCD